jgi:capsular exopolysaccharide synthesis family protein
MAAMTLVQLRDVLLKRQWRTIVAVFAAAFLAGLLVIALLPREYEATATLFVGENRPISTGASAVQLDEVLARSYAELLGSGAVTRAVGESLEPPMDASDLEEKVSFEVLTGTRLIEISALDEDPERAQGLANTYAKTFVDTQHEATKAAAATQIRDLRERIEDLARELDQIDGGGRLADAGEREAVASELTAARDALGAAQESVALQGSNVSIASSAEAPSTPARPRTKLYALLAAVLAALLAVAAGLLRNSFDKRLRDEDELVALVEAPIIARIPLQRAASDREAVAREAYQFLRTNLRLATKGRGGVIAVTSASPGEGKTSVVAGIARAIGSAGDRVVAVDCDFHRPMLAPTFGVDGREGVTNVLVGALKPDELLQRSEMPDLKILPGGPVAPNPGALVTMPVFTELLDWLRGAAQYVLVDTAPIAAMADASAVTSLADAVILVVDLELASRDVLVEACAQLRRSNTPVVGVVLNRVRESDEHYGEYGYGARPTSNGAQEWSLRRVLRRERQERV